VGDRLWIQETWAKKLTSDLSGSSAIAYRADYEYPDSIKKSLGITRWKPSTQMRREYSRLTLLIKSIRLRRLQQITPEEICAEGLAIWEGDTLIPPTSPLDRLIYLDQWIRYWDSSYSQRGYGWGTNPWVWVLEWQRLDEEGLGG
jgi:hypothetical protein